MSQLLPLDLLVDKPASTIGPSCGWASIHHQTRCYRSAPTRGNHNINILWDCPWIDQEWNRSERNQTGNSTNTMTSSSRVVEVWGQLLMSVPGATHELHFTSEIDIFRLWKNCDFNGPQCVLSIDVGEIMNQATTGGKLIFLPTLNPLFRLKSLYSQIFCSFCSINRFNPLYDHDV